MNERDLLEAGAVLPLGADVHGVAGGDGGGGDVLAARGYRHPALEERVVVRLVPEALGEAEDLALEYLGFDAEGGEPVGRVARRSLGFPAWALVHDPGNGRHALAVVKEMERLARMAATRPGHAKDGFDEIATRLDRSVPHFLPTYYEQVARLFLAAESTAYASSFFGKARDAERRHALEVDEERLREVFLEFAAAGALSGKTLREQAKGLAERLAPEPAFEQFRVLCVERGAAGLAPYAGMVEDLRRLAKAAGRDVLAEEIGLVTELLRTGPIVRAPQSFWKTVRPALIAAGRRSPAVRARLLHVLPTAGDQNPAAYTVWLDTLESAGAFALLAAGPEGAGSEGIGPEVAGPEGAAAGEVPGAAEWFGAWAGHRRRGYWRRAGRVVRELELVARFAAQLVREGEPVRLTAEQGPHSVCLDLLDAFLAAGVPVTGPHIGTRLDLAEWLDDEEPGRRDLAAVAADPRYGALLRAAVESVATGSDGPAHLRRIAADPVLGPVAGTWLAERAADLDRPLGLPELARQLSRLARFTSPEVLATGPAAAERIAAFDVAPVLAGALRAGLLDELGWPALDEAVARLRPAAPPGARAADPRLEDAWPALLVARGTHVLAVGPDAVLDDRVLTLPVPLTYGWDRAVLRRVDGQWLIASGRGDDRRATWSGRPADVFRPQGTLEAPWRGSGPVSVPLPGGGRWYGTRPVFLGDRTFGDRRPVASDGLSYWVLHERRWYEYDPATATRGRASVPGFFDSALGEGVAGAALAEPACRLLPVQPGLEGSPFGSKDGLLGWWVRYDPAAGTLTACSVDGTRSPALPCPTGPTGPDARWPVRGAVPVPPLRLPGAVLHPVVAAHLSDTVRLYDAAGIEQAMVEGGLPGNQYAGGTALVPPLWYWHALRPRDEAGSAVLRTVTDRQAAALLAALPDAEADAVAAVRRVLPGVTHPALVQGIAALAGEAARAVRRIAAFGEKSVRATEPAGTGPAPVVHALDGALGTALAGLQSRGAQYRYVGAVPHSAAAVDQMRAFHGLLAEAAPPGEPAPAGPLRQLAHSVRRALTGPVPPARTTVPLTGTPVGWPSLIGPGLAAAAQRAAAPGTPAEDREALLEFLDEATGGAAPLADPRGRLRVVEMHGPVAAVSDGAGQVYRSGDRLLLVLDAPRMSGDRQLWKGLEYAPDGRFGPWEGHELVEETTFGAPDDPERAPGIRRLIARVRESGPVPYRPAAAERFAELTGVDASSAALLLLGMPRADGFGTDSLPSPDVLALAGLRPAVAATARHTLRVLTTAERIRLLARLVPADPEAVDRLWRDGFDPDALAAEWIALRGRQRPVPVELIQRADRETALGNGVAFALNPELRPELTGRTRQRLTDGALAPEDHTALLTGNALTRYADALRWLAYRLPYGDPLRAVLPDTLGALRARLADEGLLLSVDGDWTSEGKRSSVAVREAYGLPETGGAGPDGCVAAGPALVLVPDRYGHGEHVWLRPAPLLPGASPDGGPDHPALVLLAGLRPAARPLRALRDVLGDGLTALVTADGPAGAPQYPSHSAPELVAEASARLGLSADAAALYLMLLALPDPTDRQVAGWTGWQPARAKRARAELAATDLVVAAKRARAGRGLFLPGGWLDAKAPRLPMETWKAPLFGATLESDDRFVVPGRPVPELLRQAWQRVVAGDPPGFEEFAARRTGRGGARR